jgi:hypothetical protein
MNILTKPIETNALTALAARAPAGVVGAIKQASARTGVNFAYLMRQAAVESNFRPQIKAKTSSATGLYQFIESTWLSMVKKYGPRHGLETQGKSRSEILALRKDPQAASLMAAEFASENEKSLNANWGGKVGSTELYLAHFLGAGQASAFLKARDENPLGQAALIFPQAARANRNVFYDTTTGRARSLEEVYGFFDRKFQPDGVPSPQPAVATVQAEKAPVQVYAAPPAAPAPSTAPERYANSLYARAIVPSAPAHGGLHGYQPLLASPVQAMLLSRLDLPSAATNERRESDQGRLVRYRSYNS